ncbi:MAG: amidase family protein, partial [Burkholderiaceae bacterium]
MTILPDLTSTLERLRAGPTGARDEVGQALAAAGSPACRSAFLALAKPDDLAQAADAASPDLPLAGLPVSVKDLFDIAGQTTTAGSRVLHDAPPARQDAVAVA